MMGAAGGGLGLDMPPWVGRRARWRVLASVVDEEWVREDQEEQQRWEDQRERDP